MMNESCVNKGGAKREQNEEGKYEEENYENEKTGDDEDKKTGDDED